MTGASGAPPFDSSPVQSRPHETSILGIGLGMFAATMFAVTSVTVRFAYRLGENAFTVTALRTAFATMIVSTAALAFGGATGPRGRRLAYPLAIGATLFAGQTLFLFEALARMPASTVVLTVYIYPAMALLIGVALRRERLDPRKGIAVAASFAGVALVLATGLPGASASGVAFALASALCLALFVVLSGRQVHMMDPLAYTAIVLAGATMSLFAVGTATGSLHLRLVPAAWGWSVLFGVVLAAAAITYIGAIRAIGPSRAAIADTFGPLAALVLAAFAFGERPTLLQLVGGAMVLTAVAIVANEGRTGGGLVPAVSERR